MSIKTIYMASDGTEFTDLDKANEYESNLKTINTLPLSELLAFTDMYNNDITPEGIITGKTLKTMDWEGVFGFRIKTNDMEIRRVIIAWLNGNEILYAPSLSDIPDLFCRKDVCLYWNGGNWVCAEQEMEDCINKYSDIIRALEKEI